MMSASSASSTNAPNQLHQHQQNLHTRPIVYSIAGSDSGGGAGIQADLLTMHSMHCHGCSAITSLTAQSSVGVSSVHVLPASFLSKQLDTLLTDLPPVAIKIGMLGSTELVHVVADTLKSLKDVFTVLDPVMVSTSGHSLMEPNVQQAMIDDLFPLADIVTPNQLEATALCGVKLSSFDNVEQAARDIIKMGARSVLIKGGHAEDDEQYAHDYFLASFAEESLEDSSEKREPRLCDAHNGVWLRSPRYKTDNTHGTGCTLSSAMASAYALGERERRIQSVEHRRGAYSSIDIVDACLLAKAYVTAGILASTQLGRGPGPVAHTNFPNTHQHYPTIVQHPSAGESPPFRRMVAHNADTNTNNDVPRLGRILPIVDSIDWVERLCTMGGVTDMQLRIKHETSHEAILRTVKQAQELCQAANVRLWINDHWQAALEAKCYGVHFGQEDLYKCMKSGGLNELRQHNLALGISTHSFGELAVALGVRPSYVSLGPIFCTTSKHVQFDPQGLDVLKTWRNLIPPDIPLVAIGGINDAEIAAQVRHAGADCVAVIGAITQANDAAVAVAALNKAMV
ncbi:hypothetical protein MPSEU_001104500 [Mayamaea pseudoterrestris]|nr:hypothetical protein MPSEU_001104500 [Mayamaea pseudoterrestris]